MKQDIGELLLKAIKGSLKAVYPAWSDKEDFYLDIPSDARFGDLSSNVSLRLSRMLKRPPQEVAASLVAEIKKALQKNAAGDYVREIRIEGAGFINFYLNDNYFYGQLRDTLSKGKGYFRNKTGKGKRVLLEFVSANPTGPLSVAHARQAAVGDVLSNIMEFSGFKVKREYYLNDEGNQINILGKSIELRLKELNGEKIEFPEDHYQGDYIRDIAREIKAKNKQVPDFSEYGVEQIMAVIKKELDDFGVRFDYWYSQRDLRKSGKINKSLDFLKNKGLIYEQEGALWFKSTQFGDDKDRVVIKSDGLYTYLAPDIAYHRDKLKRKFNLLVNLWGPDHHGYINRLKAAVAAIGADPQCLSVIIVQLASIFRDGKPVQMSTRRGQYITLREVLDEVGRDASRFFFLMRRTSSHLDFDLAVAKKQTSENPVYYVQYAHARICSILRSSPGKIKPGGVDFSLLQEKEEIALAKKIWEFSCILEACVKTLDPYMLTVYLQDVACTFHKFYDRHRVLGQEEGLVRARMALIEAARIVISCGLELAGVSCPEKM